MRRGQGVLPPAGSRAETVCQPTTSPEVARGSMAIGGAVLATAVRHMHSTVERETDQLKKRRCGRKDRRLRCWVRQLMMKEVYW